MPNTLNEFIEKKVEELVENPEFRFHPSVMHFFRWSLRECADEAWEAGVSAVESNSPDMYDYCREVWFGTDKQPVLSDEYRARHGLPLNDQSHA